MVQRHFSGAALYRTLGFGGRRGTTRQPPPGAELCPMSAGLEQCSGRPGGGSVPRCPRRLIIFQRRHRVRNTVPSRPRVGNSVNTCPCGRNFPRRSRGERFPETPLGRKTVPRHLRRRKVYREEPNVAYRLRPSEAYLHRKAKDPTNHHEPTAYTNSHRDGSTQLQRSEGNRHHRPTGGSAAAG
jgi:hypothetical protein